MLVLTRKPNQSIIIGDDVEITIVDIQGDKVKLGVSAPRSIPVYRKEVYEAIQKENIEAARAKVTDLSSITKLYQPGSKKPKDKETE